MYDYKLGGFATFIYTPASSNTQFPNLSSNVEDDLSKTSQWIFDASE